MPKERPQLSPSGSAEACLCVRTLVGARPGPGRAYLVCAVFCFRAKPAQPPTSSASGQARLPGPALQPREHAYRARARPPAAAVGELGGWPSRRPAPPPRPAPWPAGSGPIAGEMTSGAPGWVHFAPGRLWAHSHSWIISRPPICRLWIGWRAFFMSTIDPKHAPCAMPQCVVYCTRTRVCGAQSIPALGASRRQRPACIPQYTTDRAAKKQAAGRGAGFSLRFRLTLWVRVGCTLCLLCCGIVYCQRKLAGRCGVVWSRRAHRRTRCGKGTPGTTSSGRQWPAARPSHIPQSVDIVDPAHR